MHRCRYQGVACSGYVWLLMVTLLLTLVFVSKRTVIAQTNSDYNTTIAQTSRQQSSPAGVPLQTPEIEEATDAMTKGMECYQQADYTKACQYFQHARKIFEKVLGKEHPYTSTAYNFIGLVYKDMGDYTRALQYFQQALEMRQKVLGLEHVDTAQSYNSIGEVYRSTGDYVKALEYYQQSLMIIEKVLGREHLYTAICFNNIGEAYRSMGNYAKALAYFQKALTIYEKMPSREYTYVARSCNNIGAVYTHMGDYAKALAYYQRARDIRENILGFEHPDTAQTFNNIGSVYDLMGDYAKALEFYLQSLAIVEKVLGEKHPYTATSCNNIGSVYRNMGDYVKALDYFKKSLIIREVVLGQEHPETATSYNNVGAIYDDIKDYAKALKYYQLSLTIMEKVLGQEHPDTATCYSNIGEVYRKVGDYAQALEYFTKALPIAQVTGVVETTWRSQSTIALSYYGLNRPAAAIFFGKQAVNTIQRMRRQMAPLDKNLQKRFLKDKEAVYKNLAEWLVDQKRLAEAQQVLDLLKQEEYFDYVDPEAKKIALIFGQATLTPQEATQAARYQQAVSPFARLGGKSGTLFAKKQRTPEEEARLAEINKELKEDIEFFQKTIIAIAQELTEKQQDNVAHVKEAQDLQKTLQQLGQGTMAIYTLIGEQKFRLLLITPDFHKAYASTIQAKELNQKIFAWRQVLQDPKQDPRPLARELYNIILAPAAGDLKELRARNLMWSLDGALRYLPVAALYDGEHYLTEIFSNTIFTPASQVRVLQQPNSAWKGLGFGVSEGRDGFKALSGVEQELVSIIKTSESSQGIVPGQINLNDKFTLEALKTGLRQCYPLIHIASHFQFSPGDNTKSFLLLGKGRFPISELVKQNNLFNGVDLLTLSACNTGFGDGKPLGGGQEVEGFGVAAQRQGAKGIIATLWPVADQSTCLFMQSFYRLREQEKLSKGEALRQAQLVLLRGQSKITDQGKADNRGQVIYAQGQEGNGGQLFTTDPQAPYAHPFYWAPFILMGNWQ